MPLTTSGESRPENVRAYLRLTRLLDGIQHDHPEVSAPLRLTLLRARRDGHLGSLDESRFRAVVAEVRHAGQPAPKPSLLQRASTADPPRRMTSNESSQDRTASDTEPFV